MDLVVNKKETTLSANKTHFLVSNNENAVSVHASKVERILLHSGVSIDTAAVFLALSRGVDISFIDRRGDVVGRVWNGKFGSITKIRRKQLEFSASPAGLQWIKSIVEEKIQNQIALALGLLEAEDYDDEIVGHINTMEKCKFQLHANDLQTPNDQQIKSSFRGLEGASSRAYFSVLAKTVPAQYFFEGRSRRPAHDMFNALLNYAYGMLYNSVEAALLRAGIDPSIGVLHADEYNKPTFAYDVIEKYRVWADFVVVDLCKKETIFPDFFTLDDRGYWLEAPAKQILIHALNDYMDEKISLNGKSMSRKNHIDAFCSGLAQTILNFEGAK